MKFRGLAMMDMNVVTWISNNKQYLIKYFVGMLNSWIVIPTKYTKLNVQQIKVDFTVYIYVTSFKYLYISKSKVIEVCPGGLVKSAVGMFVLAVYISKSCTNTTYCFVAISDDGDMFYRPFSHVETSHKYNVTLHKYSVSSPWLIST